MLRLFRLALCAAVVVCGLIGGLTLVQACPFCSAPTQTLSEQLSGAQAAVLVQWVSGKEANRDEGFVGETEYQIVQLVRDESHTLKKDARILLDRYRVAKPGDLFLLFGTQINERIEWSSPLEVSEASFNYVVQAPSKESPVTQRLGYYLKFLEYPDPLVADDAYAEFSNAPYGDIVQLASQMPREKLRQWLHSAETKPTRLGLYGLMLGLCGNSEDAAFLKGKVLEQTDGFRLGIDGVMGGYLLLTGKDGLNVLEQEKLKNTKAPFSETFAAMQSLRFMWEYAPGRIPPDDLRSAMRLLLERPNLADLVIVDLARWSDWSIMNQLMAMYQDPNYQVPSIKRAIVRFMLIAEKNPAAASGTAAPPQPTAVQEVSTPAAPAHVTQARANLVILREQDPKTVKAAEKYFFD